MTPQKLGNIYEIRTDCSSRRSSDGRPTVAFWETRITSQLVRDRAKDHLLTPQNSALIVIDEPVQVTSVASLDRRALVTNIASVAKLAKLFKLPVVLSTVNVKTGRNAPTIHQLQEVLPGANALDRTTINAWEDHGRWWTNCARRSRPS
ncbi:MAG: hypothetical protein WA446_04970 [Steroidobacteraceae bacterium]